MNAQRRFVIGLGLGKITLELRKKGQTVARSPLPAPITHLAIEGKGAGERRPPRLIPLIHLHFTQAQERVSQ